MKIIFTIFLVILGLFVLICISSCSTYKEERFRNKLVEDFKTNGFEISNPKYTFLKVDDMLIDIYISYSPYRNSYLIKIGFYNKVQQSILIRKILVGRKKILVNKEVNLGYQLSNGIFTGDLVDINDEEIVVVNKKDFFDQVKAKKIPITVYFNVNNQEKDITIEMEQYTVRDIIWPT